MSIILQYSVLYPDMKQIVICQFVSLLSLISFPLGVVVGSDLPTGWLHSWYCPNYLLATPCPSNIQTEPKLSHLAVGHVSLPVTQTFCSADSSSCRLPVYENFWIQEIFNVSLTVKCSDDGVLYLEVLGFWTLSIVWCSNKTQRFGNWICFRHQVKRRGHLLCRVS
jgi:hypothetical protein